MAKKKKDQRAEDQDAAVEEAFVEGTLPEEDRRITMTDAAGDEYVWVDDGSEVPQPGQPEDAGAALHRDNHTTPAVKADQHSTPGIGGTDHG